MKNFHKKIDLIDHLESVELPSDYYDEIQGTNDLEMIDNVTKKRKAKLTKKIAAGKFKGKKLAKKKGIVAGTRMTTFGKIAGVATGGASLLASKAGRKTAKKIAKVVVGSTVLLPLQPLRGVMIKGLKKEGVNASKTTPIIDLANLFYKHVVRKNNSSFEEIDLNNLSDYDGDNFVVSISAIVSGIIAFIKGVKKKKASGTPLTKAEEIIVEGTEAVEAKIEESAKDEAASEIGETVMEGAQSLANPKTLLIIGAGALAVIVFFAMLKN
jgi:hypothetical protein